MFKPAARINRPPRKRQADPACKKKALDKWNSIIEGESVNQKRSKEPHFTLQGIGKPDDPEVVLFKLPCCPAYLEVKLFHLRVFLILANLEVLYAGVLSLNAWIAIDTINQEAMEGMDAVTRNRDPFRIPHRWIHDNWSHELAHGFAHADQMLFASGILLVAHWLILGLVVSRNYVRSLSYASFSVLSFPAVVLVAFSQLALAVQGMEIRRVLADMDCDRVRPHLGYRRTFALKKMRDLLEDSGQDLIIALIVACFLEIVLGLIPFFLYDLPFQRKMDIDELVLSNNPRTRSVRRYKNKETIMLKVKASGNEKNNNRSSNKADNLGLEEGPSERDVTGLWPYRSLSAAYTVMLQLCKPEYRDFHRSYGNNIKYEYVTR